MSVTLSEQSLLTLYYLAAGQDPFTGCSASGDFGQRLLVLAALRRSCLIDHHDHLTDAGQSLLLACAA